MSHSLQSETNSLHGLARLYRVLARYRDGFRVVREPSREVLVAVLRELGAPLHSLDDVPAAIASRREELWSRVLDPVVVLWRGRSPECRLRLPESLAAGSAGFELRTEDGAEQRWSGPLADLRTQRGALVNGRGYVTKLLPLPAAMPIGYHRLRVEFGSQVHEASVICAPTAAHSFDGSQGPLWGLFLPLYALRTERSWGAGDFTDLGRLGAWTGELGGSAVGTLPLLASYLDEPFDPSPYSPVSRLFWNEFYVDPAALPEFERCPAAKALVSSADYRTQIESLRQRSSVDYRLQMGLKRRVLEELAKTLLAEPSDRREAFRLYVDERPELDSYARFRATVETRKELWPTWPGSFRDHGPPETEFDQSARDYHLYCQWAAEEQMASLARQARAKGPGLYLDLPLGVHPGGFDVWRQPDAFALGVSGGAPPDRFFTAGQDWGFAPQHPEGIRAQGYAHFIACLRHHLGHAGILRIDHVMGLHRLYWIPKGMGASQGTYVQYRPREFYAILALESCRHEAVIVGEDLGTVPKYVRGRMSERGLKRMYVAQFQFRPDVKEPLGAVPRNSVAGLNTHDMRPFAGFWKEYDIDDQMDLGLLNEKDAQQDRNRRRDLKRALLEHFREPGVREHNATDSGRRGSTQSGREQAGSEQAGNENDRGDAVLSEDENVRSVVRGEVRSEVQSIISSCLSALASSDAEFLMINLEDLWEEALPQNTPGTLRERENWRRKARYSLEEIRQTARIVELLRGINRLRKTRLESGDALGTYNKAGST